MSKSLTLAGSGIKFLSHLTEETKTYIRECDKLLYLINDPVFKQWIKQNKPNSETLDGIYHQHAEREQSYEAIAKHALAELNQHDHVCMLIYGHPTVFSSVGLKATQLAQSKGVNTKILPGISALDCLLSDIGIDPAIHGCQSFEATDFLIYHRQFDPCSHLVLWQIDVIGLKQHSDKVNYKGLKILSDKLLEYYPASHRIVLYEAAQYPGFEPTINETEMEQLSLSAISPVTTLYIPPARKQIADIELLGHLI